MKCAGKTDFICPGCQECLVIHGSKELYYETRPGSIFTREWFNCPSCNDCYIGSMEEFLSIEDDSFIHIARKVPENQWKETLAGSRRNETRGKMANDDAGDAFLKNYQFDFLDKPFRLKHKK